MEARTETRIILTLSMEEARWLRAITQNPLRDSPENEDPYEAEIRQRFFNAIPTDY